MYSKFESKQYIAWVCFVKLKKKVSMFVLLAFYIQNGSASGGWMRQVDADPYELANMGAPVIQTDDSRTFVPSSTPPPKPPSHHLLKTVLSLSLSPVLALFPNSPNSAQSLFLNTSLPSPCGCVPIYLPSASVAQ